MNRFLEVSVFSPEDWHPQEISEVVSWQGHIPFAFSLIRIAQPSCFVELGTHKGDSYLAFCEAVKRYSLPTKCFAVDTWKGDAQTGYYGKDVLQQLRLKHDSQYDAFSELMRSTFDDAVTCFEDGSIDLLHIDGLHSYEAVRNDFNNWQPKLSDCGIVLFHDTEVRQGDFGVWRLWEELSGQYKSFNFSHSNGLGVLAVGKDAAGLLPDLFDVSSDAAERVRALYSTLGNSVAFHGMYRLLLAEREDYASTFETVNRELAERNGKLAERDKTLAECNKELAEQDRELSKRNSELAERNKVLAEQDRALAERNNELAERDKTLTALETSLAVQSQQLAAVLSSTSWKITAPIRYTVTTGRLAEQYLRDTPVAVLRAIYHRLPVSTVTRNRLKDRLYHRFPLFFAHTLSYRLWKTQSAGEAPEHAVLDQPGEVGGAFDMPCPQDPIVSIVIPVYGKIEYTYRCLRSLWSHRSYYSFEVIVVDDCSPDNTLAILETIKGLRIVRNSTNAGFIRSCNIGAGQARGKLLVMLNNDTVVLPGWLDELVNTFNCVPQAGLVGSKLMYPDGRLQEAGGIIWADGSGWNYGRLEDPNHPAYNHLRDVDYCSGASLMIPKGLFDQLGGFDEHYAPAYGEDSDLAFRVRRAGYRVLYQPLSQAVHFEGITSGRQVSAGVKAYQVDNARKLHERWKGALADHGAPGMMVEHAMDRSITGRALVLDHCTPTPDQDAGSITILNIMRILQSLGLKVSFIPEDNFLYLDPYTKDLQRVGMECLYAPHVTSVEQHLAESGARYDVVVVFRMLTAERNLAVIRKYCPNAKLVFHTSDLHFLREQREAGLFHPEAPVASVRRTMERELAVIKAADATIVHSIAEKEILKQKLAPDGCSDKIFLFGWAIEIPGTRVPCEPRDGMVFVGGFQHQPNVDAVLYFAREIFPLIRRKAPETVFRIVGSHAPSEVLALAGNGIEVLGFVEDLRAVLDRCRMSVVPVRYGAGIKGKIGTSLSYGLPCVSTAMGAEGMGLGEGDGVIIADGPEAFAEAVLRLDQDPVLWETLSRGGLEFVQRNYSLESGVRTVGALLKAIGVPDGKLARRDINRLSGNNDLGLFVPDQLTDPLEVVLPAYDRTGYEKCMSTLLLKGCRDRENEIIDRNGNAERYFLTGYCRVCRQDTDFLVDRQCGAVEGNGKWLPNWRERLVCGGCGLNNRQRMIMLAVCDALKKCRDGRPEVYLMEQVTPFYHWLSANLPRADWVGSEYLGDNITPGKIVGGIRHENTERLSFGDSSFDLVVSNDVLEHVADYKKSVAEIWRVLKPNGVLLLTVPFHLDMEKSQCRAKVINDRVEHILPPVYHGNPMSDNGSLVFTDLGWDLLQVMRESGFAEVQVRFYWSEVYGHLGTGQNYIYALKG